MSLIDRPSTFFLISFCALWLAAWGGSRVARRYGSLDGERRDEFEVVRNATLTLLALLIGFSFSMAISRYDQRKVYEEAEANAIGTQYLRADLLPSADAANLRSLLLNYLDQRILFYVTDDEQQLRTIGAQTTRLQNDLWAAVRTPALERPSAVTALAVDSLSDVLNSEGYTQSAWWNRIPNAAWTLMMVIAIFANALVGFGAPTLGARSTLLATLPAIVSIAFFLIADIDGPRSGFIHVSAKNLERLAQSLRAP